MQVSNSSVARPWTMEIRTKHLGASFETGFEAGFEGLQACEIGARQYDKEGTLFVGPQNVRKSRHTKMDLPCSRFPAAAVAGQIIFNLK